MRFDPSRRVGSSSAEDATGYLWTHKGKHTKKSKQQTKAPQLCGGRKGGKHTHSLPICTHMHFLSSSFLYFLSPFFFEHTNPKMYVFYFYCFGFFLSTFFFDLFVYCFLKGKERERGTAQHTYIYNHTNTQACATSYILLHMVVLPV